MSNKLICRVIYNDCNRTRIKDQELITDFLPIIKAYITYFCKITNIYYKQGLNEISGPLILLKHKIENISLSRIFNIQLAFVERFLTNFYQQLELFPLWSCLSMLKVLIKYHLPLLNNLLEYALVSPEMYATSWILTLFASKTSLDITYYFWDMLINEGDKLFILFFIVSFLDKNSDKITSVDISEIPLIISRLTITSIEEITEITYKAKKIRYETPYSFTQMCNKLEIFKPHSDSTKELNLLYQPSSFLTMPVLYNEIFFTCYRDLVTCPDNYCTNFKKNTLKVDLFEKYICDICLSKKTKKRLNYIIIDLRHSREKNTYGKSIKIKPIDSNSISSGFLPLTLIPEQDEFNDENFVEDLSDKFVKDKDHYHFILLTNETTYFQNYENKYYHQGDNEKYQFTTRKTKVINSKLVSKVSNPEVLTKVKEYENFKKLLKTFSKKNFSYISFVPGGFKEIHFNAIKYDIPLLNHDEKECELCKEIDKSRISTTNYDFKRTSSMSLKHKIKLKSKLRSTLRESLGQGTKDTKEKDGKDDNLKYKDSLRSDSHVHVDDNDDNIENIDNPFNSENPDDSDYTSSMKRRSTLYNKKQSNADYGDFQLMRSSFTFKEVGEIMENKTNLVFSCILKEYNTFIYNDSVQIITLVQDDILFIYRLEKKIGSEENSNELEFYLIETIIIDDIIQIIPKKDCKNIITTCFESNEIGVISIVIDFINITEAKKFISIINHTHKK